MLDAGPPAAAPTLPISAVERDTGLSKDTLRVWERRYGFPQPVRDENGERAYPADQVERLRLITRLLSSGLRPGRVVSMGLNELQQLVQEASPAARQKPADDAELHACLELVRSHDVHSLRRALNQAALRLGLACFVTELLGPLNLLIGDAWLRGEIQVFEEHMYTECVTAVLRSAIGTITAAAGNSGPRVLLTTIPQEAHGLGLLMAETMLTLEGCDCVSLGVQTPIAEIVQAAVANQTQIVGLSFSASLNANQVVQALQELRAKLPSAISIWAGGSHASLRRRDLEGITPVPELLGIKPLLAQWRLRRAAASSTAK
jgi:DNA-binding transcriptional MerR regulator/methylmalonyl-CoA mutase cobalamin-binding subunit